MRELLDDNKKQIEQMNDDSKFYLQCRDLVIEVFKKPQREPVKKRTKSVFKSLEMSSALHRRSTLNLSQSKSHLNPLT